MKCKLMKRTSNLKRKHSDTDLVQDFYRLRHLVLNIFQLIDVPKMRGINCKLNQIHVADLDADVLWKALEMTVWTCLVNKIKRVTGILTFSKTLTSG